MTAAVASASDPAQATPQMQAAAGYRLVASDGGIFNFASPFFGSAASNSTTCAPRGFSSASFPSGACVSMATTPTGNGYWILNGSTGAVTTYGDAVPYGTPESRFTGVPQEFVPAFRQIVGTPSGQGYWVLAVGLSGLASVEVFGDARSYGDETTEPGPAGHVGTPVGMAATAAGAGYWIVDSDGGVFAFGDAPFYGSMGGKPLDAPVVGIAGTPDGGGYWLVAADGGVFAFGDAPFYGSMGGRALAAPVVGIAPDLGAPGYWLAGSDGGVFSFGYATFQGSMATRTIAAPVVGISASPPA